MVVVSAVPPAEIRRVRRAVGLSQARFGRLCGVSKLTVLRWEAGQQEPHPAHVDKIVRVAKANGITVG